MVAAMDTAPVIGGKHLIWSHYILGGFLSLSLAEKERDSFFEIPWSKGAQVFFDTYPRIGLI
jgi:hypothetical protein